MKCKACEERVKDWEGSDPLCAFEASTEFSEKNWNCATVSKLREICYHVGFTRREPSPGIDFQRCGDQSYTTFNLHQLYEKDFRNVIETPYALWVCWYKNRGKTEAMWLLFADRAPRQPTEEECLAIAKAYEHILQVES